VKEGYVDWLLPMLYVSGSLSETEQVSRLEALIDEYYEIIAGPEGIIPMGGLLIHGPSDIGPAKTPTQWKPEVDLLKQKGFDGWSSWPYGGLGDPAGFPDITLYWSIIDRPDVFSLSNITVSPASSSATITWATDLPATSKVEYSATPLFTETKKTGTLLDYWDIDHVPGTVVEDVTPRTSHSITLTGLSPGVLYYYRVQSEGSGGIATSKVYTFEL